VREKKREKERERERKREKEREREKKERESKRDRVYVCVRVSCVYVRVHPTHMITSKSTPTNNLDCVNA